VTEGTAEVTAPDGNNVAVSTETFKVTGLKVGNEYIFRIYTVAKLENGSSLTSDPAATAAIPIVPEKVTGVKVSSEPPVNGSTTKLYNKISWDIVKGAVAYDVWRINPDDSKVKVAAEVTDSPYYDTDTAFKVGDVYKYYVQAVGANSKKGSKSSTVKVTVLPLPVSGLKTESAGSTKVYLKWDNMGVDKYQVYRSTKSGVLGSLIKTTTSTSLTNGNLTCGTTYYYTIKAVKVSGSTSYVAKGSTQVKGKPLPLAPKLNSASPTTALRALLKWSKSTYRDGSVDTGVTGYQMAYRIAGSGDNWASGGSVSKSKTSGKAKTQLTKKEYEFAVRAYKTVDGVRKYGPYSEIKKATLEPMKVKNLKAGKLSTSYISLTWKGRTDVSGYNIYISTDNSKFTKVGTTTELKYTLENLTPGVLTYIRVTCFVTQEDKTYEYDVDSSTSIKSYIRLKKPTLTLDANVKKSARVTWEKIKGASGYEIRAKIGKSGSWKTLDKISDSSMVAYLHDTNNVNLAYNPSKEIYYQVRAFAVQSDGSTVYSSWSAELQKPKK
jgi:fibronectin type 3 domain-containing protein